MALLSVWSGLLSSSLAKSQSRVSRVRTGHTVCLRLAWHVLPNSSPEPRPVPAREESHLWRLLSPLAVTARETGQHASLGRAHGATTEVLQAAWCSASPAAACQALCGRRICVCEESIS